jgi:5-methyltetrahydrofolate--homocysteine methyltransferase
MAATGLQVALIAQVTVELTGTMLLGSEIGAALAALEPLGIDVIGMNCATGPAEMSEHLRFLSQHATVPLSVMPNAGLPVLGPLGRGVPPAAGRAGRRARAVRPDRTAWAWSAAAAAPRRSTCGRWWSGSAAARSRAHPVVEPSVASLYAACPSGRTPAC